MEGNEGDSCVGAFKILFVFSVHAGFSSLGITSPVELSLVSPSSLLEIEKTNLIIVNECSGICAAKFFRTLNNLIS